MSIILHVFLICDQVHGTGSAASAKAQLDLSCAYIALQGKGWYSKTVWAHAANATRSIIMVLPSSCTSSSTRCTSRSHEGPEYQMYIKSLHPELVMMGMWVPSQVISASSCEQNWSSNGHM